MLSEINSFLIHLYCIYPQPQYSAMIIQKSRPDCLHSRCVLGVFAGLDIVLVSVSLASAGDCQAVGHLLVNGKKSLSLSLSIQRWRSWTVTRCGCPPRAVSLNETLFRCSWWHSLLYFTLPLSIALLRTSACDCYLISLIFNSLIQWATRTQACNPAFF